MTIAIDKDVFWFEVTIYDVEPVEEVEGECDLCGIELGDRIWESL